MLIDPGMESESYSYHVSDITDECVYIFYCSLNFPMYPNAEYHRYIVVGFCRDDGSGPTYRISLDEPTYIYDSDKLPEKYRGPIIKAIFDSYKDGLSWMNEDAGANFDLDRPIPDYNLL